MSDQNMEHAPSKDSDMRYFPRWVTDDQVQYHVEGEENYHKGKARDISCAGACITGNESIAPHQKIQMTIYLSKGVSVNLNAKILWTKTVNNQPEMGVTFYNTADDVQDLILQHAFKLDKNKVVNQWYKGWQ